MSYRIVIAGAGGFGREVHSWLATSPGYRAEHSISSVVFINDEESTVPLPTQVVSTIKGYAPQAGDRVLCAIGEPASRRKVVSSLLVQGAQFTTFVHDSVIVGTNVSLGEGTIVCPGTILTSDLEVGRQVHININSSIGHDVMIGDYATISPACNLMGGVELGEDVFLGTAATLVPGTTVHHDTMIGAGSVVLGDIEANVIAFGNPCRVARTRT